MIIRGVFIPPLRTKLERKQSRAVGTYYVHRAIEALRIRSPKQTRVTFFFISPFRSPAFLEYTSVKK